MKNSNANKNPKKNVKIKVGKRKENEVVPKIQNKQNRKKIPKLKNEPKTEFGKNQDNKL